MNLLKLLSGTALIFNLASTSFSYPKQPASHYEACADKKHGDACVIKDKEKKVYGSCKKDYQSKVFCDPASTKSTKEKK